MKTIKVSDIGFHSDDNSHEENPIGGFHTDEDGPEFENLLEKYRAGQRKKHLEEMIQNIENKIAEGDIADAKRRIRLMREWKKLTPELAARFNSLIKEQTLE